MQGMCKTTLNPAAGSRAATAKRCVLILSRDAVVRDLLAVMLKSQGWAVAAAAGLGGPGGAPEDCSPRAVILDLRPAGFWGDGPWLPPWSSRMGVKVIALVPGDRRSVRDEAPAVEAGAILMHPFGDEDVRRALECAFAPRAAGREG